MALTEVRLFSFLLHQSWPFRLFAWQEEKRKAAEKERKKAEVRARLEEAARAKKGKKGFMTPERKRKLRVSVAKSNMPNSISFTANISLDIIA